MSTTTLSKTTVSENGSVVLPKNFDSLSQRKQREIVITAIRDEMISVTKLAETQKVLKEKIKQQNSLIKNSAEYKGLMKLKKQLKDDARLQDEMLIERGGMIKIARSLGLVSDSELKNIRLIEA